MATQCRSPRCTAERKGFRRELDSWRHRLIHCVGFESILEGLYGPGLRRDLSLFDDCEPEELVDWCADDRCSLCSLRKDTVSDCTPSADSAQSTPTGELISQGQFNAEKIECQAENYLNALFQKKDLPQNCDPNIPLVAQELMKKMIRQFAIEYVSKSRKLHQENNGTLLDPAVARNSVQLNQDLLQEEQDGPLDLTVTRIEENFQCEDGVLDLSIKKNGLEENSKMKNSKIGVINIRILKKLEKSIAPHKKISALMEVFNSLCQYHKQQLKLMFRFLTKEHKLCSKMCNKNEKSPIPVHTFMNQRLARNGVLESPYLNLPPVYVRLKDLRLTCPNIARGTVKLNAKEHVDLHIKQCDPVSSSETIHSRRKHAYSGIFNRHDSPSSGKRRKMCYSAIPLLSERDDATHSELNFSLLPGKQISNVGILDKSINSLFEDLICCIAKEINGTDAKPYPQELCSIPKLIDTVQMRNLVDHLINKIKQNGYSFTQALNQYLKSTETRFSQTRFCKRQEKAAAWNSPALSLSRRQSLRIKRELWNLMETFSQARTTPVNNSEKRISNKERAYGVLVVKKYGNTPTVATTNLPRCNLKMHSNTVDCSNNYLCLPDHSALSPIQTNTHGKEKVQSHIGPNTTVGDGLSSNYCRGGLESYKESLVSQGRYSVQNASNLFCKCTSKQFSGTIQDTRVDGVQPVVTAGVSRNTHLKVVIERLKDPFMSTNTKSSRLKRKHKSKRKETSFVLHSGIENTCYDNKVSLRPNVNKNTCTISVPQDESAKSKLTMAAANHKCNPLIGNRLCSPVKIMFVSKIDGAEGIKYTLSSVYNSSNQKSKVNFLEISDKGEEAAAAHEKQLVNDPLYFSSVRTRKTNDCEKNRSTKEHRCREVRIEKRKAGRSKHVGSPCLKQIRLEGEPTQLHDKGMQSSDKPNEPEGSNTLPSQNKSTEHSKITLSIRFGKSTFKRQILKMNPPPAEEINLKKSQTHSYDSTKKVSQGLNSVPTTRRFTLLHSGASVTHKPLPVTTECTPPKEGVRRGANTVFHLQKTRLFPKQGLGFKDHRTSHKFCQKRKFYNTRSTRSSALRSCQIPSQANRGTSALHSSEAFSALSSSQSLLDKANTQSINKHKVHDRTLVTQKPCESPSRTMEFLEDNDKSPVITSQTSVDSVSQSNEVLKWWSTSTPSDSLLKDLDSRYEQMINTWQKNTGENHFSPAFQLQVQQQIKSPIQMLFEKKYDMSNISTWFMQTTETKSLSVLPKANARSPMEISNHKGAKAGKTHVSVISRNSRKRQRNCMRLTHLDALNGHQMISKFVQPENVVGTNTKIRELKCQEKLNLNNIQSVTRKSKPVHLKFRHLGDNLEDANVDERKYLEPKERKSSSELASTRISTSVNSLPNGPHVRKHGPLLGKKETAKGRITYVSKSTENFKGCKVFITKCKDIETKTPQGNVCSLEQLHLSNATELKKCTIQSIPKIDLNTDAKSQGRKSLKTLSLTLKTKNSLNEEPGRNLRKSRGPGFTKASPTSAWILEKRNDRKRRKTTSVCRNTKKPRLLSVIGKMENDYSKYLLGPLKPVRLPSTKGLSSKHGMYSLTPIRIPDSRRTKQGNT